MHLLQSFRLKAVASSRPVLVGIDCPGLGKYRSVQAATCLRPASLEYRGRGGRSRTSRAPRPSVISRWRRRFRAPDGSPDSAASRPDGACQARRGVKNARPYLANIDASDSSPHTMRAPVGFESTTCSRFSPHTIRLLQAS